MYDTFGHPDSLAFFASQIRRCQRHNRRCDVFRRNAGHFHSSILLRHCSGTYLRFHRADNVSTKNRSICGVGEIFADAVAEFLEDYALPAFQGRDTAVHRSNCGGNDIYRLLLLLHKRRIAYSLHRDGDITAAVEFLQALYTMLFATVRQRI